MFLRLVVLLSLEDVMMCMKSVIVNNFEEIWGPVLGKLVSATFDKKRMTHHSVFSPGFKIARVPCFY